MRKVCIIGVDHQTTTMFLRQGWEIAAVIDESVDLLQFTGGEDVDPSYYGQTKHPATYSNPKRDAYEVNIYNEWVYKIPMAGICRGGQLLNVLNGGSMWQHVTNHSVMKTHTAFCHLTEEDYNVTSVHHQMMIPAHDGKVLLSCSLAQTKQTPDKSFDGFAQPDVEAIHYEATKCLCYQPHPEYVGVNHECQTLYFKYLDLIL
jgi:gamma-glutamyl-gamma-aminobutyrate hydrolase PuuD